MSKYEELKKLYGFNSGDVKWLLDGAEFLKYIGQELVYIDYKRDPETKKWSTTLERARLVGVDSYDPVTLTYDVKYQLLDRENKDEVLTLKIIPEGYSFDVMGQGIQNSMKRFTTMSLHGKVVEESIFYNRCSELFNKRKTLPWEAVKTLAANSELAKTLQYAKYIAVVIKHAFELYGVDDEMEYDPQEGVLQFRLSDIRIKHDYKNIWRLTLVDKNKKSYTVEVDTEADEEYYELKYQGEYIGDVKLIDLGITDEDVPVSNP